jgi:hypothetical protein
VRFSTGYSYLRSKTLNDSILTASWVSRTLGSFTHEILPKRPNIQQNYLCLHLEKPHTVLLVWLEAADTADQGLMDVHSGKLTLWSLRQSQQL